MADRVDILLVDDHPDNLVALEAILADLGQNIVKVHSGKEALKCLLQRDFAVILLDVNMPIMDGFETAALIRTRMRSEVTPIIFITAYGNETHVARGYSLGAVDYILTPVVPEVLRAKVSVFVELFRTAQEVRRQSARLRERAGRLRQLTQASLEINTAGSIQQILQLTVDRGREIVGAQRAEAEVRLERNRAYRAASGVADPGPGGVGPTDGVCVVPLATHGGAHLGEVRLAGKLEDGFTQEDRDVLVQLGQMASIAIDNSLYTEERETNRLKDEFLATVSHELRTPLSAMLIWAGMLRTRKLEQATVTRGLEVIERSAKAQAQLVDDLLDMSRIITGKMRLDARGVDLRAVTRGTLESVAPAAEAKAIALDAALEAAPVQVRGDPDRLQQVLWNVLSNAIKFTPRGGRITVRLRADAADAEISVSDTGAGIKPEFLPHVFDRFRQAESSAARVHGGLGLGLAIVRHLVDLHGGAVRAESAGEGCGATFVITLPLATGPAAAATPAVSPAATRQAAVRRTALATDLGGLRVLVVDDDVDGCDAIATVLGAAGAEIRTAGTADAAMRLIVAQPPDVLVSDVGLPGEDGYGLLARVRAFEDERGVRVPAIALTAYASAQDRSRALAAGFQAHLAKPVEPDELIALLAALRADQSARPAPDARPAAPLRLA